MRFQKLAGYSAKHGAYIDPDAVLKFAKSMTAEDAKILQKYAELSKKDPKFFSMLNKVTRFSLKNLVKVSGVVSAGMAGYQVGELISEYDQNHWDGKLTDSVGAVLEPGFAVIYQVQRKFEEPAASAR